jgi:hypothetical protein
LWAKYHSSSIKWLCTKLQQTIIEQITRQKKLKEVFTDTALLTGFCNFIRNFICLLVQRHEQLEEYDMRLTNTTKDEVKIALTTSNLSCLPFVFQMETSQPPFRNWGNSSWDSIFL